MATRRRDRESQVRPTAAPRGSASSDDKIHTSTRLARYIRPYLGILLITVLCALVYAGARAGRAYMIKPLTDGVGIQIGSGAREIPERLGWLDWIPGMKEEAAPETERSPTEAFDTRVANNFQHATAILLLVVFLIPLAHFGQSYLIRYALGRVLVDMQQDLCDKVLRLPLRSHQQNTRGELLSRATNDATRAHTALEMLFNDVLIGALALVTGGVTMLLISWQLTLLVLLTAPVLAGSIAYFGGRIRRDAMKRQQSFGDVTQRLVEILSSMKVIKAFGAEELEARSFSSHNRRLFRRSMKVVLYRALSRVVVEGVNNGVGVAILLLGGWLVYRGAWGLTPGSLIAFVGVMASVYRPVKDLTRGWNGFMDALPSAERFFELLDLPAEVGDTEGASPFSLRDRIRVQNLHFAYGREPVLEDVNFEVSAGEVIAIVGRTGAGKTTLADLLVRFYDPDRGSITFDGRDLRDIARQSLMKNIAVVTQEPLLLEGTIRDNIRYGRPDASTEDIERSAEAAHVMEFAERLPLGLDTPVGEAGGELSGGQRQRVTIARAILKNPALLIFDEATSALDAKSERFVQDAVESMMSGRTVFVIAHRLSTIRNADKILVLDRGRVLGMGKHEELVARDGLYRELVALQSES
jgi:subfamily B ATP-binding cassette protein MsbA